MSRTNARNGLDLLDEARLVVNQFAFLAYITINNKGEEVKLNMEFSKAELDVPVETNFTIPDSYERMSIPKKK